MQSPEARRAITDIERAKAKAVVDLLRHVTEEQRDFFYRRHPGLISDDYLRAIDRTIVANKRASDGEEKPTKRV